jgi:hypothetical protein
MAVDFTVCLPSAERAEIFFDLSVKTTAAAPSVTTPVWLPA